MFQKILENGKHIIFSLFFKIFILFSTIILKIKTKHEFSKLTINHGYLKGLLEKYYFQKIKIIHKFKIHGLIERRNYV